MDTRRHSYRAIALILVCSIVAASLSGCRAFRGGRHGGASVVEGDLDAALDGGPTTAQGYLEQADAQLNAGDKDAALQAFSAAIEMNPKLFRAHMGMGDIYRETEDYEQAEKSYRHAVESNPRSYEANYFWGMVLHQLNRIGEAIRAYRAALTLQPRSHEANLNLATAYLQLDQAIEAYPFAKAAAALQPDHGPTQANLGVIQAAMGQHEEAVKSYHKALELLEPSPEMVLNLVESYRVLGRHSEMANSLEALVRVEGSAAANERLGFAHFKLRQFDESIKAYRQALTFDDQYFPAMNGLAVNLLNQFIRSDRQNVAALGEAIELLRQSLQIERDQPRIVELLSRYGR
ncbi:MAG: tetratricopeptide repeat protein [Planctomycetes bacterium]|nr:tetratricopeptide repeat protein [Planctomycetota bacterium]NOG54573.1 tetratricopeptide repeat protein [Planctomycetota bacterium]